MPEQIEHQDTQTAQISGTVQIKPSGERQTDPPDEDEAPAQKSGRKFIVIAVIILLVIGAGIFYWRSTFTEDTDDAQVDGDLYQVSSRVTGQVIKVYVDDNQQVQVGAPIAEIDPKDYQVAVEQAQANLASAQAAAIQPSSRPANRPPPPRPVSQPPRPTPSNHTSTWSVTPRSSRRTSSPSSSSMPPSPPMQPTRRQSSKLKLL